MQKKQLLIEEIKTCLISMRATNIHVIKERYKNKLLTFGLSECQINKILNNKNYKGGNIE